MRTERSEFTIFRIEEDGWCDLCDESPSFHLAEITARTLAVSQPGRYVIINRSTGDGTVLNLERSAARPGVGVN